mmetsp:Transcript_30824/g.49597  ORF Transcript_30824/g.49597 Transcript_30824/m.49597 type:complete len:221 (-) Transcript_30824:212-874(-)
MSVRNADRPSMLSLKLDFFSISQPLTLPVLISTKSRPFLILGSNHSKGTRILLRFRNRRHSIVRIVIEGLGKGERSKTFFSAQNLLTAWRKYLQDASRLPVCGHKNTRIGAKRSYWTLSSRCGGELLDKDEEDELFMSSTSSKGTGVSSYRPVRVSMLSSPLFLFLPPFLTLGKSLIFLCFFLSPRFLWQNVVSSSASYHGGVLAFGSFTRGVTGGSTFM